MRRNVVHRYCSSEEIEMGGYPIFMVSWVKDEGVPARVQVVGRVTGFEDAKRWARLLNAAEKSVES